MGGRARAFGVRKVVDVDMATLERIVKEDSKQRYSFNEDRTRIRANQGHSIPVDVELTAEDPPEYLYHGTTETSIPSIEEQGLLAGARLYVHLTHDPKTAERVGARHGKAVVYRVSSKKMAGDGFIFYRSVNDVWLTKAVPTDYLSRVSPESLADTDR